MSRKIILQERERVRERVGKYSERIFHFLVRSFVSVLCSSRKKYWSGLACMSCVDTSYFVCSLRCSLWTLLFLTTIFPNTEELCRWEFSGAKLPRVHKQNKKVHSSVYCENLNSASVSSVLSEKSIFFHREIKDWIKIKIYCDLCKLQIFSTRGQLNCNYCVSQIHQIKCVRKEIAEGSGTSCIKSQASPWFFLPFCKIIWRFAVSEYLG